MAGAPVERPFVAPAGGVAYQGVVLVPDNLWPTSLPLLESFQAWGEGGVLARFSNSPL